MRELAADTKVAILKTFSRTVPEAAEEKPEDAAKNLGQKWKSITFEQLKSGASFLPKIDIEYLKTGEDNAHLYKIYTDAYAKLDSEAREDANISWQMGLAANAKFKNEVKLDKAENPLAEYIVEQFKAEKKALKTLRDNATKNPLQEAFKNLQKADFSKGGGEIDKVTQQFFKQKLVAQTATQPTAEEKDTKKAPISSLFSLQKQGFEHEDGVFALNFAKSQTTPKEIGFKVLNQNGINTFFELNSDAQKFGSAISIESNKTKTAPYLLGMGLKINPSGGAKSELVKPRLMLPKVLEKLQEFSSSITEKVLERITQLGNGTSVSLGQLPKLILEVQNNLVKFANRVYTDASVITEIDKDAVLKTADSASKEVAVTTNNTAPFEPTGADDAEKI